MYIRSLFPELPETPETNHHNILFHSPRARTIPDHVMHICGVTGRKRTRSEFLDRIYNAATALGAKKELGGLGLNSTCMVGVLSDNCLEYLTIIHALLVITTPFALLSSHATPRELRQQLEISQPTHLFVHASLLSHLLVVAKDVGFPEDNIFILEGDTTQSRFKSLDQLINHALSSKIPREPIRDAKNDTLAYIMFSSGTSGVPKAAMISHDNITASFFQNGVQLAEYAKVLPPTGPNAFVPVTLGFLPFYHGYGLHIFCLRPLIRPTTIVVLPRWNLDLALDVIPRYKVTTLTLVPSVMHILINSPKVKQTDLSSLQVVGSGAAYTPPLLINRMKSIIPNAVIGEGYGMTEATITILHRPTEPKILNGRAKCDLSSTGILVSGLEALILRPDGTHCSPNEAGELYVKGRTVGLGYWNNPEATRATFLKGGWLRTGDRFSVSSGGIFRFEDRIKDTLKISGMQVSPAEIEDTILAEPSGIIADVAVAGVLLPNSRTSDEKSPRAWIVLTEKGRSLGEEKAREVIESWTRKNLSRYKWLRGGIEFVDELPKNPTGKVLRRILQDQYEESQQKKYQAKL